ncbi:MAG: hypothetical protein K0Q73_8806 [Paenibacillus sp.]|nr:hypothetical protein [Paenibacillus sp.]
MKLAYTDHHYMLLRFQQASTQTDRIKLALAYMENVAPTVDEAMKGAIENEQLLESNLEAIRSH